MSAQSKLRILKLMSRKKINNSFPENFKNTSSPSHLINVPNDTRWQPISIDLDLDLNWKQQFTIFHAKYQKLKLSARQKHEREVVRRIKWKNLIITFIFLQFLCQKNHPTAIRQWSNLSTNSLYYRSLIVSYRTFFHRLYEFWEYICCANIVRASFFSLVLVDFWWAFIAGIIYTDWLTDWWVLSANIII